MSIAHWRTATGPHYLAVAVILAALAAAVLTTAALNAAAGRFDVNGDTRTWIDNNGNGVLNTEDTLIENNVLDAGEDANLNGVLDGEHKATITPGQSANLLVDTLIASAGLTDTGFMAISGGQLFSANSGIKQTTLSWTGGAVGARVSSAPVPYFPSGFVGNDTVAGDNTSAAAVPGTENDNITATITVVGPPVAKFYFTATPAVPAIPDPGIAANRIDRIGNLDCGSTDCNTAADLTVLVKDANGTNYPNNVVGNLTFNPVTNGLLVGNSISTQSVTQGVLGATLDLDADGKNDTSGVFYFIAGDAIGNTSPPTQGPDATNDARNFIASQSGRGTTTFTITIASGSMSGDLIVTGPPASLGVEARTLTFNPTPPVGGGADTAVFGSAAPFALGQTQTVVGVGGSQGNDVFGVEISALDADGTTVGIKSGGPTVVDGTGDATLISFAANAATAARPPSAFGAAGAKVNAATPPVAQPALGVSTAIGDAPAGVAEGDRTIAANFTRAGGTVVTGTTTIRQAGAVANLDTTITVVDAQTATLGSDQIGNIVVEATSADGGIVGDGTVITIVGPANANILIPSGGGNPVATTLTTATVNGQATATLLPTGDDEVITLLVSSGAASEVVQVAMSSSRVGEAAPVSVTVEADETQLALGEATRVRATVELSDGGVGRGITGVWSDTQAATASVPTNVTTTNSDGISEVTFVADNPGNRNVTFTVVNLVGGVVVETAIEGFVRISVGSVGTSGLTSLTSFSAWISGTDTTASQLFAALREQASVGILWKWDGSKWISFALIGTTELPGSENFNITLGDILFIGRST